MFDIDLSFHMFILLKNSYCFNYFPFFSKDVNKLVIKFKVYFSVDFL